MSFTRGIQVAIFNLVIVGVIGCILRYTFVKPISGLNYGYVLHAHSHLAFLGWVFMALYVLMVYAYLPPTSLRKGKYLNIFIILQIANLGMLVTFPIMGYAAWSIVFSAIHAITAVVFAWLLIKDVQSAIALEHRCSFRLVKWALILMIISNLAPFALGPVSAIQGKTDLYYLLIYFYLHFQYNGWFIFALLGLLLWQLEIRGVNTDVRLVKVGFTLKLIAVFPAFVLSALWTEPDLVWYVLGGVTGFVQLLGLLCIVYFIVRNMAHLGLNGTIAKILFWTGMLAVSMQHVLMLLSAIPAFTSLAFSRNIVIAYLHMVLLGCVTIWLFFLFIKIGWIQTTKIASSGFLLFLSAFVVTELILLFQGQVNHSGRWLFYLANTQLCGILCIAFSTKMTQGL